MVETLQATLGNVKNILSYHKELEWMTGELSSTLNKLKDHEKALKDSRECLEADIVVLKREKTGEGGGTGEG